MKEYPFGEEPLRYFHLSKDVDAESHCLPMPLNKNVDVEVKDMLKNVRTGEMMWVKGLAPYVIIVHRGCGADDGPHAMRESDCIINMGRFPGWPANMDPEPTTYRIINE